MVVELERFLVFQLQKCPKVFQQKFKIVYEQLKIVNSPLDVKNITAEKNAKDFYKLYIEESRIVIRVRDDKLYIECFLFNQYFDW